MYNYNPYRDCASCRHAMNCPMMEHSTYEYDPMMYRMDDSEEYEAERLEGNEERVVHQPIKHVQPQQKQMQKKEQEPMKQAIPQPKQEQYVTHIKEQKDVDINIHPKVEPQYMELTIKPMLQATKMELDIEPNIHPKMEPSNMELNIEPKMGAIIVEPIRVQLMIQPIMEPTTMQLNIQPILEQMLQPPQMMAPELEEPVVCPITKCKCDKMEHQSYKAKHQCHKKEHHAMHECHSKWQTHDPSEQEDDVEYQFKHPFTMLDQSDR